LFAQAMLMHTNQYVL